MTARQHYQESGRFDFHTDGHGNRRDRDAEPHVLACGYDVDGDRLHFHRAGDNYIRSAHVCDAALDDELVAGLEPRDALRLGMAYERVRKAGGV